MEYLKLLVDLAKAIAWPSAVFALGYMFRSDVRALFPRLTKAGPTGLEFDPARQLLAAASKELKELPGFSALRRRTPRRRSSASRLRALIAEGVPTWFAWRVLADQGRKVRVTATMAACVDRCRSVDGTSAAY